MTKLNAKKNHYGHLDHGHQTCAHKHVKACLGVALALQPLLLVKGPW